MVQVVPLRYDTAFKKAFSQPDIFRQFVHDVLGIDIHIDTVHRGYKYIKPVGQVDIEYDLFAEDEEARIVVEIQHVKEREFYDRFLYYHLISMVEQVKSSRAYKFDKTAYTVVVLTSLYHDPSIDFSVAIGDLNPVNEFNRKVEVYPHQLVFLVPRMVNEQTPKGIKAWLELISDSLDEEIDETRYNSPIFRRVIEAIELDNTSPEDLRKIKDEASWDHALREEREDGREEGREDGREEGREEGREDGRQLEKESIVLSLLREGVDVEVIARTTGLERERIEELRRS